MGNACTSAGDAAEPTTVDAALERAEHLLSSHPDDLSPAQLERLRRIVARAGGEAVFATGETSRAPSLSAALRESLNAIGDDDGTGVATAADDHGHEERRHGSGGFSHGPSRRASGSLPPLAMPPAHEPHPRHPNQPSQHTSPNPLLSPSMSRHSTPRHATASRRSTLRIVDEVVAASWERTLDKVGRSHAELGARILRRLFARCPDAQVYYYGVPLERQGVAIARMIAQVVRVESQAAAVVPTLLSLGARHALYGFEPKMLSEMKHAAMEALDEIHADDDGLAADELEAWDAAWRIVLDLMTHGMEGPAGVANRERYEAQAAQQVKSAWDAIRVKQVEGGEEFRLFSRLMYKSIIQQRPELKRFSNLTDFRTADRIMAMLTSSIEDRAAGRDPTTMLRECGHRHIAYNVTADDMREFHDPFLHTVQMYLGEERMTLPLKRHFSDFWRYVVDAMDSGMTSLRSRLPRNAPSTGPFAIAFTDIEKSTRLWETYPGLMQQALDKHNRILRQLIQQHGGYEVKTIGDSFMVAFPSMSAAAVFACAVQTELMLQAPIAPGFKMVRPTQGGGPDAAWDDTTLRVRVGIEWCTEASPQYDAVHRRMDYFGPSVNVAARVEGAAGGGQVLVTGGALAQLQAEQAARPSAAPREFLDLAFGRSEDADAARTAAHDLSNPLRRPPTLGEAVAVARSASGVELKGVGRPVDLYTVLPIALKRRTFQFDSEPVSLDASWVSDNGARRSSSLRPLPHFPQGGSGVFTPPAVEERLEASSLSEVDDVAVAAA